jgi:hypothetical protein
MKLKTLLLGSAAAFAAAGGAQAADLTIAEAVDYVRVCDAFGVGYWYIPGTDTCLRIGGYVQLEVLFHEDQYTDLFNEHSAVWEFATEASLDVTAKSMTEYGPLTGYLNFRAKSHNADPSNGPEVANIKAAYLDSAWLELGPLLAGYTGSTFDYGGSFTYDGSIRSDTKTDQLRLTWAMSGFGLMLAVEDPRDRWGSHLDYGYSIPDIIGAVTLAQGHWDAKISAGYTQGGGYWYGGLSGWGVQAGLTATLDAIAPGDQFRIAGAFSSNAFCFVNSSYCGSSGGEGTSWSAYASFKHYWQPNLYTGITGAYASMGNGSTQWKAAANLVWSPVTNFEAGIQGLYTSTSWNGGNTDVWGVKVRLKRSWGS